MATVKEAKGILGKDISGKGLIKQPIILQNTGTNAGYLIYVIVKIFWSNMNKLAH